jgi:prevent-host-death family protein
MHAISASDASRKLSTLLNQAQHAPVMIRNHQRNVAVMLSMTEYHRLSGTPQPKSIDARLAAILDACD